MSNFNANYDNIMDDVVAKNSTAVVFINDKDKKISESRIRFQTSLCLRYLGATYGAAAGGTQGAEVMAGQCLGLRPPVPLQFCDVSGNALATTMLANYLYASDVSGNLYD